MAPKLYFKDVEIGLIRDPFPHIRAFDIYIDFNVSIQFILLNVRLSYNIINTYLNFLNLKGVASAYTY